MPRNGAPYGLSVSAGVVVALLVPYVLTRIQNPDGDGGTRSSPAMSASR